MSKGGRPKKPEDKLRLYPVKVYFDETNYRGKPEPTHGSVALDHRL